MKLRRGIFISLILATAMIAAGGAVLLAADSGTRYDSNHNGIIDNQEVTNAAHDYFDGSISQEDALDMLPLYLVRMPVEEYRPEAALTPTAMPNPTATPWSTPTATPSPTSIPTPTSTPSTTADWLLSCPSRSSGYIGSEHHVVRQISRHVEASFRNPSSDYWEYGFKLRENEGKFGWWKFYIASEGEWRISWWFMRSDLKTTYEGEAIGYLGHLFQDDAPFNSAAGEYNHITIFTRNEDLEDYKILVNGVEMPVISRLNGFSRKQYAYFRTYSLIASSGTRYEALCTQDSWTYNP